MPASAPARRARGVERRDAVVRAAADLMLALGPSAVTHRAVAARAHASLSATTYYFAGRDDLLAAAGTLLVDEWVAHAQTVLDAVPDGVPGPGEAAATVVAAVLPDGDDATLRGHYEHLLSAGRVPVLSGALAGGRGRLDAVVAELLGRFGSRCPAALAVAVVDGAVVTGLSEGRPVRPLARDLVAAVL